ncbi:MAG: hypothetical protein IKE12_06490 [Erysipelotrichaceae bacterium]|nr:hypothetical protein [Erysipelotrichaceae bacterium]
MDRHFTLKQLKISELSKVSQDIKKVLKDKKFSNSSSLLSMVDINVALNYVFDCEKDDYIFDMEYMYDIQKILNGSFEPKWKSMHPSTAMTAGYASATVRDDTRDNYNVIVLLEEKSVFSNMSLEALKSIGESQKRMLIIVSDCEHEKKTHGNLNAVITKMRYSRPYVEMKKSVKNSLSTNVIGLQTLKTLRGVRDSFKQMVVADSLFKEFSLDYIGPINGNNMTDLVKALRMAQSKMGPIVIHVVSDRQTVKNKLDNNFVYTNEMVLQWMSELLKEDENAYFVNTDFPQSSVYDSSEDIFADRYVDFGYSYNSAVTFASGLANKGHRTFVLLPSVAVQRCYDQINDIICRNNLPVTILINDAGLIGEKSNDFGVYDVSLLSTISNLTIAQPANASEMYGLIRQSMVSDRPMAIRYPLILVRKDEKIGNADLSQKWSVSGDLEKCSGVVITYGHYHDRIVSKCISNDMDLAVVNARIIKPMDLDLLDRIADADVPVFVYATDIITGGLGQEIINYYYARGRKVNVRNFALNNDFDSSTSSVDLKRQEKIDINSLFEEIDRCLKK